MSYTKTTWANGDVINAQKMNNIENGIANAYYEKYDFYDYVIKKVGLEDATIEKGTYQDIYNALQNQIPVVGLYIENSQVSQWHDASSLFIPLTQIYYYSSADALFSSGLSTIGSSPYKLFIQWREDGIVDIEKNNL